MSLAQQIYEVFKDDEEKATVLSRAFELLEKNLEQKSNIIQFPDPTQRNLELSIELERVRRDTKETEARLAMEMKETENRLAMEIEKSRRETREIENRLVAEITKVENRLAMEMKETENRLAMEMKETEARLALDIEKTRREIEIVRSDLLKHMNRQIFWILGAIATLAAIIKALDYILP